MEAEDPKIRAGERVHDQTEQLTWDEVVRVGPGTPGGNYLRCFWWPVALADEVKDIPVLVKLLGEELVLFRDLSGRLTFLGAYCSHRRASLEYGIIQTDGIRCAYHGWCYDRRGNSSTGRRNRSKPRQTFTIPGIHAGIGRVRIRLLGKDKESPPPLPRYDVLVQDGYGLLKEAMLQPAKPITVMA